MNIDYDTEWGAIDTPPPPLAPGDGLTPKMRELRDGAIDPVSDRVRELRARQIRDLEHQHAEAVTWCTDLDRARAHLAEAPCSALTLHYLDELLVAKIARCQAEADGLAESIRLLRQRSA